MEWTLRTSRPRKQHTVGPSAHMLYTYIFLCFFSYQDVYITHLCIVKLKLQLVFKESGVLLKDTAQCFIHTSSRHIIIPTFAAAGNLGVPGCRSLCAVWSPGLTHESALGLSDAFHSHGCHGPVHHPDFRVGFSNKNHPNIGLAL